MKKWKKHISKKHLSIIPVVLLLGILIGLLPLYFRTTQRVSAAPPSRTVIGTVTIPSTGYTCTTPNDSDFGNPVCIVSQVALPNPPASVDCEWAELDNSDPTFNNIWNLFSIKDNKFH